MKKWVVVFDVVVILVTCILILIGFYVSKSKELETASANIKAYDEALTTEVTTRALQLKVDQLEYFNDSVLKALDSVRNELGIKDKNLKSLQYISSRITKTDTIVFVDTLFKDRYLDMDTIVGDAWYELKMKLKYPYFITVTPCFLSKKYIVVSLKKETVNPPKKYWIQRLFQKKHKVVTVDIKEENPYVEDEESRYIEIIK